MTAVLLSAPPMHVEPVDPPPPLPPPRPPGRDPERRWELRSDGVLLGVFRQQGRRSRVRSGAGEAVVECSLLPEVDPVAAHLFDSSGKPRTWRRSRLEVWCWRDDELRHQGPVVAQQVNLSEGTTTVRSWTREGYVQRLMAGMRQRVEYCPQGRFTAGLPGWSTAGSPGMAASTQFLYGSTPRSMLLSGSSGSAYTTFSVPGPTSGNTVRVSVAVRVVGDSWWPGDCPFEIWHLVGSQVRGVYRAELSSDAERETYHRVDLAVPQRPGGLNRYLTRCFATPAGSSARFGLVTAARWANASAVAGSDIATWPAAVFAQVEEDDPSRPWSRLVTPTGETWEGSKRELLMDHGNYSSMLGDVKAWGEWWVDVGSHRMRWAPTRGSVVDYPLSPDRVEGLELEVDATASATRVAVYADGQGDSGPTRDEAVVRLSNAPLGAVLDHAEQAQPGTDPRDLESQAARVLAGMGDEWSVSGSPAEVPSGLPSVEGLPGDVQHLVEPGSRVPLVGSVGVASVDEQVVINAESVDDVSDVVTWEVASWQP